MRPPSYVLYVFDRNVVMRLIPVMYTASYTHRLYGIAYFSQATNLYSMLLY